MLTKAVPTARRNDSIIFTVTLVFMNSGNDLRRSTSRKPTEESWSRLTNDKGASANVIHHAAASDRFLLLVNEISLH
ncbi:MAG TPA: hypothetical protein VFO69_09890 [Allosphingosinicella sp.]|nr:hypothetical protein [Allosphingosinicella sp.]